MPFQNRVDPFGVIRAVPERGLVYGNRGGRIHRDDRTLRPRPWASRQWICCVLSFKNRHHEVMGPGYTGLFFLDEPTAFAAGHRPCFECRRADAKRFAGAWAWAQGLAAPPRAPVMDLVLQAERVDGRAKRLHDVSCDALPDGAMIALDDAPFAVRGDDLLPWSFAGYGAARRRPAGPVSLLTPPAIAAVLGAGYVPAWHPSAA